MVDEKYYSIYKFEVKRKQIMLKNKYTLFNVTPTGVMFKNGHGSTSIFRL